MADRDVTIDIIGRDRTGPSAKSATRNFEKLRAETKANESATDKLQKRIESWSKSALGAARSAAALGAKVAAVTSLVGPATTGVIAAAKGVAAFGRAAAATAGSLAPLVAFVPSLVGSMGLLVGTTKLIGPAIGNAFSPVIRQFYDADGNATKLTRHLEQLASKGIAPLAKQFVKVNLPSVSKSMGQIAVAENSVVVGVAKWINSIPGQKLIRGITQDTATAAGILAPHVTAAAIAVGNLAARAGSGKFSSLSKVVGDIADKFTAWANSVSSGDIQGALDKVGAGFDKLKTAWDKVKALGGWLVDIQPKIKDFSNAIATLGLTVGIATGDWPAVLAAGFSLIANNWDKVKGVLVGVKKWFDSSGLTDKFRSLYQYFKPGVIDNWKKAWNDLKDAFKKNEPQIKQVIGDIAAITGAVITVAPYILTVGSNFLIALGWVVRACDGIISVSLKAFALILAGAVNAFGWIPGIGPKLKSAQKQFNEFAANVTKGLQGIPGRKDINIHIYKSGNGATLIDNQGEIHTVGNRNIAISRNQTWAPQNVVAQFMAQSFGPAATGDGQESHRTGGPTQAHAEVHNEVTVLLDGHPIAARIRAAQKRQEWRQRVGKR